MIVGNDISGWQGDVNYDLYVHHTNFLIIKATEGVGYTDKKFLRNQSEARRKGIPLGYYHFARPDLKNQPEAEADYFLKVVGQLREGEMLCLDYEPVSNPFPVVLWCQVFLTRVFNKTGVRPLIYLNKSQVRTFDWSPVVAGNFALWLASYDGEPFTGQWGAMAMQQWTSKQQVPGISGNVDGNWFFGTVEQFKAYGYHAPVEPSSSVSRSPSASSSGSSSPSRSPSSSPSPSLSPSSSQSPSVSLSPSPSQEIPDPGNCCEEVERLALIIKSQWTWFGKNVWYRKLAELRRILSLYEENI